MPTRMDVSVERRFVHYLGCQFLFACVLWLACCIAFIVGTLPMENVFAELVRTQHPGLALTTNLRLLPGYLLLVPAYAFLAWPLIARRPAVAARSTLRILLWLVPCNLAVHALSLGPLTLAQPDAGDLLQRVLAHVLPAAWAEFLVGPWLLGCLTLALMLLAVISARLLWRTPRLRVACVIPLCVLLVGAAQRSSSAMPPRGARTQPDILILASDSLRADRLGCHGSPLGASPHMDALAREGVRFDAMHVACASTLESWTTLLTGCWPQTHGLRYMFIPASAAQRVQENADTLPRVLARGGWHTAVSSNWAGNCFKAVDHGFAGNHASDIQNLDVFVAEAALQAHWPVSLHFANPLGETLFPEMDQVTSWLSPERLEQRLWSEMAGAESADRPFFGVLFTSHTHLPYMPTAASLARFRDPDYSGPNQRELTFDIDDFIMHGFPDAVSPQERAQVHALYAACVKDFDDFVGSVIDRLRESGRLEHTIVIITSDHGDDLYDPGTSLGHGTNFFGGDQTTRIPFIVRFPAARHAGRVIESVTRASDVMPMLLTLAGLPVPGGCEGTDLMPLIDGRSTDLHLPAFAETCYLFHPKPLHPPGALTAQSMSSTLEVDPAARNSFVLKAEHHEQVLAAKDNMLRTRRWKLLRLPMQDGVQWQLYDMQADPEQRHDLAGAGLPVMRRLQQVLEAFRSGDMRQRWSPEDDDPQR